MKRLPRAEAAGPAPEADPSHFTGRVEQLAVFTQPEPQSVRALVVGFADGARTHWHAHAGGQVLHVLEGSGQVQARGCSVVDVGPGDLVVAEPGEEHWHGAAPGASMRHLAISLGAVDWRGPVEPGPDAS